MAEWDYSKLTLSTFVQTHLRPFSRAEAPSPSTNLRNLNRSDAMQGLPQNAQYAVDEVHNVVTSLAARELTKLSST